MPIYEYNCPDCGTKFERMLNISQADEKQECPVCKAEANKTPSLSSFQLKGGGWYKDGYTGPSNKCGSGG